MCLLQSATWHMKFKVTKCLIRKREVYYVSENMFKPSRVLIRSDAKLKMDHVFNRNKLKASLHNQLAVLKNNLITICQVMVRNVTNKVETKVVEVWHSYFGVIESIKVTPYENPVFDKIRNLAEVKVDQGLFCVVTEIEEVDISDVSQT